MKFRRALKLLNVAAVAAIVLPLAYFGTFAWITYEEAFSQARKRLDLTVSLVREHGSKVMETQVLAIGQIDALTASHTDEQIRQEEPELNRHLKRLVDQLEQVQDMAILNREGKPLAAGNLFPVPDVSYADRPHFRAFTDGAMPASATYVGPILLGRIQRTTSFYVARARSSGPDGAFTGIIAVGVSPGYFQKFFQQIAGDTATIIALIRSDGSVLVRQPKVDVAPDQLRSSPTFLAAIAAQPERGIYETVSPLDGGHRIVAYERIASYPLYVNVGIDRADVIKQWRTSFGAHLIFGLPATLCLLVLTLVALRYTRAGNQALTSLREEVARREATELQLRQSQKMEALGQLTGGVAHDFNNLLTIILGNIERARSRSGALDGAIRTMLDRAYEGASRAATLTQRLLAFSRQQPLDPTPIECNRLVSGMSEMLHRTLGEDIAIETVLSGGLWRALADPNQLESAILNLAVNARDAMPKGGKLTIETGNAYLDETYARGQPDVTPGQYVSIAVTDTGVGMPPDVRSKAFDPFFTTKPPDQGTGLGLSQVYGFVKQSGGHVAIYSEVGQGTTVKIYLPRAQGNAGPDANPAGASDPAVTAFGDGRTILVVEDDAMVRRVSVDILEDAGYHVLSASSAERALALLRSNEDIWMLFSDVVLGGSMNGRQLADEALKLRPELKVLFTTGYSRNAIVHHGRLDAGTNLIVKPFTAADLLAKVNSLLSR